MVISELMRGMCEAESLADRLEEIANRMDFLFQGDDQKTLRKAAATLRAHQWGKEISFD